MKCINTIDAVGHVLCHDITRIVKDVVKTHRDRGGYSGAVVTWKGPSLCVGEG